MGKERKQREPGYTLENHTGIKPKEFNNYRALAVIFTAGRELSEEELEAINAQEKRTLIEIEFEGGLKLIRMKHQDGSFMELYSSKDNWFRLVYNPTMETLKTQCCPRSN